MKTRSRVKPARAGGTAPSTPLQVATIRKLRQIVKRARARAHDRNRRYCRAQFFAYVDLMCDASIPRAHDAWRKVIREGAFVFRVHDDPRIALALANLLDGEKVALRQRIAKTGGVSVHRDHWPTSAAFA
ncbi:MAG: hypothetical protein RLZZ416_28 [Candidatus Parcubacteria bacterium]|jgi:hypothetical protein